MTASLPSSETIMRVELPNGIVVLAYENFTSPSVVIGGSLWAGALSESPDQAGLASFTAGMLMRGTETHSFTQINEALESEGAQLGFRAGVHTAGFGGKALAEDLDLLLDLLAGSLRQPTFPVEEVDKLQGQIFTALQRRAHDTRRMAQLTFDALLFPDHPYGRSVQGYEETISSLSRDHLAGYHREHYSPEGMVIAIVGAVSASAVMEKVQKTLGSWQAPDAAPNRTIPVEVQLNELRRETTPVEGKTQADLVLGWPGLSRKHPGYMKAFLANTILGVFGMMGRLGDNLRDEQGLAYYVYSQLEAGLGAGPWQAIAGISPTNVERTVDGILFEVHRMRDEPVPEEELADTQSYLTGSMPLRLETNEGIGNTILGIERHDLGFDYLLHYADLINAITVEDIQEISRQILNPDEYALAIAGPESG